MPPPPGWVDSLIRSKAQVAAGEAVPMQPLLERLRARAERLERRQAKASQKA